MEREGPRDRDVSEDEFAYEDLWYIKLIDDKQKNPVEAWGGYSQDYESAENVYTHDEVLDSKHENWGVVGIQGDRSLLIFDLDIHKAPAGFDPNDIEIPENTAVVRSQNGGLHLYFVVDSSRGAGKESEFGILYNLGWGIDIRGSYVKHHVVSPANIPGIGGQYELVNNTELLTVIDPGDAAERVRYLGDEDSDKPHGEPLLRYRRDWNGVGSGGTGIGVGAGIEIDRDADPPEDMPLCYHRGLQARAANSADPNVDTHKINVLTALCGLAAGYSIETMVDHFCEEFPPSLNADRTQTDYQLRHIANAGYSPPTVRTLREYGILDEDEGEECDCEILSHGGGAGEGDDRTGDDDREPVAILPHSPKTRVITNNWPVEPQRVTSDVLSKQDVYDRGGRRDRQRDGAP